MKVLAMVRALCCGVCSYAFEDEDSLRRHTAEEDEDGDTHDSEPWFGVVLRVGNKLTWEADKPHAFAHVEIAAIHRNDDDEIWIRDTGGHWNDLARFVEATRPVHPLAAPCEHCGQVTPGCGPLCPECEKTIKGGE